MIALVGKIEAATGKIGGVDHISDRLGTLNTQRSHSFAPEKALST